jgi:tight adherence protein B
VTDLDLSTVRALGVSFLGGGLAGFVSLWLTARGARLVALMRRHEAELSRDLAFLRLPLSARHLSLGQLACMMAACLSCALGHLLVASPFSVLALSVRPWLSARRARRVNAIEAQLDAFLGQLASTLRATPAPSEALAYCQTLVGAPLSEELRTLEKEQRLGTPLDEALTRMSQRIGSRTVESALSALRVGQKTGGDLSAILERSAGALREMARLEGVIRTKTAEGKAQAFVIAAIPFPMIGLLQVIDPTWLTPLWSSLAGGVLVAAALTLWGLSILLARRILDVDI